MKLNLFPAPRRVSIKKSTLDLSSAEWIILPQASSDTLRARTMEVATRIGERLNRPIRVTTATLSRPEVMIGLTLRKGIPAQGFEIAFNAKKRTLSASDEAGLFYGLLALGQLVEQFGNAVPSLTVNDAPDFPARGIMMDVSRCKVPTLETLKLLIDRLAGLRINQLQLYIEHTFAFRNHETVWHDASPFTHEEILEIDAYCADRFIELVPNLNSFGHFERWLRHPEYRHLAECPDGFENPWGGRSSHGSTLAPTTESLKFVESLYDEYLPHFRSPMLNVGCDETWELGKGRSQKKAEASSTTKVYLDFLKRIHKACAKRGRRMQFWGDIILHQPELIQALPKDCIALNWGYGAEHPFNKECRAFATANIEFYVCPGTSTWNSITGRTDNCLANLENAAKNGLKYGATGYLNTDWGDGGHHQTLPMSYVGYTAGAGYSWNLKSNRTVDLANVISRHWFGDHSGVLGTFCLEIGRVANSMPKHTQPNGTVYNHLLFHELSVAGVEAQKFTVPQLRRALKRLDELEASLARSMPSCTDRALVLGELTHTVATARHALHRALFIKKAGRSKAELRAELQHLIRGHEEQWLARNRRGGLHESSNRLRGVAEGLSE